VRDVDIFNETVRVIKFGWTIVKAVARWISQPGEDNPPLQ